MRMITADWLVVDSSVAASAASQAAWHDVSWVEDCDDLADTFVEVHDEIELRVVDPDPADGPPPIPDWLDAP